MVKPCRPVQSIAQALHRSVKQRTTFATAVMRNVQQSEVETLIGLLKHGRSVHTALSSYVGNAKQL